MKAEKYLKIIIRMCNTFEECSDCPNYKVVCNVAGWGIDTKKAVEIAEEWDKENPAKTRLSEFLRLFPNAEMVLDSESGKYFPKGCVQGFDKEFECKCEDVLGYVENCCNKCSEEFWEEEV